MKRIPYHKMMVGMDGQEAEVIIRAFQLYVAKEQLNPRKYKLTFDNHLILKIKKRQHKIHREREPYIFEDANSGHDQVLEKEIYPAPF